MRIDFEDPLFVQADITLGEFISELEINNLRICRMSKSQHEALNTFLRETECEALRWHELRKRRAREVLGSSSLSGVKVDGVSLDGN